MTDKQMIIYGVDVSGCKYYDDGICCNEDVSALSCENTNCMYKQLARKTQECEKKSWEIGNLGYKIKNQRKEINERLKQLKEKEQECEKWKNEYRIQLDKNLDKQIKINNLLNKLSLKEFVLKVNGKKYTKFNGIEKAKIFINDENEMRNKKILELENKMSDLQWKFYNNCKETANSKFKLKQAEQKLELIRKKVQAYIDDEADLTPEQVLQIIDEVV